MTDNLQHTKHPQGVTLLLVMLILSIVSSVALAVTFLIVRQFEQGTDVRKAIEAQDIADTGAEKILYQLKGARSGSANAFVNEIKNSYVCDDPANKGILSNGEFCVDQEASFEYEKSLQTSLQENQSVTVDLYDPAGSSGKEVTALELSGVTDPDTWIEVSWVAWTVQDGSFTYIPSTTKEYFKGSEINPSRMVYFKKKVGSTNSVYFINNPFVTGTKNVGQCTPYADEEDGCLVRSNTNTTPVNYIVRIKALFGNAAKVSVSAYGDCIASDSCGGAKTRIDLPARVSVKVIGRSSNVLQALQLSIPWKFSLAGLYDYALSSQDALTKNIKVNPGFYSTGTIQAEKGIDLAAYSPDPLPNASPNMPFQCPGGIACPGWDIVTGTNTVKDSQDVRCELEPDVDASGGATCGFDNDLGRMSYSLLNFKLGEESAQPGVLNSKQYYVNYRARLSATYTDEAMDLYVCDSKTNNCGDEAIQPRLNESNHSPSSLNLNRDKDGWATCSTLVSLSSDDILQFRANGDHSPRLDWFNISTVAFVGQNDCTFTPITYSRDSYTFEATAAGTQATDTCDQASATIVHCDAWNDWLGYNRVAYGGYSPFYNCDKTVGTCHIQSFNGTLGTEVGFTYPLKYEESSGGLSSKIAEGDYYVTVKGSLMLFTGTDENDQFIFDIGNFDDNTQQGGYSGYASSYLPSHHSVNVYRAQGSYDDKLGDGTNGCVLPKQMRVIPGNDASITISDSNSLGRPELKIDSFTLSHTPPKDAFGNSLPLCTMPTFTP